MTQKLSALAAMLGLEHRGADMEIRGVNTLELAQNHELSFLANAKYAPLLSSTTAGAVIVEERYAEQVENALISNNPYLDFAKALSVFAKPQGEFTGISEQAFIHETAELGEGCTIYPFAYIGARVKLGKSVKIFPGCYVGEDCAIGARTILYPNVTIMGGAVIGSDVVAQPGAVLGSDGFGFAPTEHGLVKIPQTGNVAVGDNVEIGANTAIDRAVLNSTSIGNGVKIDNLVQLGHNVEVGAHSVLVSQVGISGSTKVGEKVTIAGQAGISGHLEIGDGVTIGPQTGVAKNIPAGATMGGTPAMERGTFMRTLAVIPKLPELSKRVKQLEKELDALKKSVKDGE